MTFVTASLMTWLPTYFHRVHHISESQAGVKAGIVMALALFGAPLGGLIADLWAKKQKAARLLIPTISALSSAILLFVGFKFFNGNAQYIILLLMGMTIVAFLPAAAAVTQDVVHPGLRASSYAICVVVQNLIGAALGPIFVGYMSDAYGIHTALLSLPLFLIFAGVLFFAGSFFYARDLDKVEKIELVVEH